MFDSQPLNGAGSKVPQMTGNIVGSPVRTVFLRVIRRTVGHGNNQHAFFRQQVVQCVPRLIQVFQMLHDVPQRDDVETAGSKILQRCVGLHIEVEVLFGKSAGLYILLHRFHLPAPSLHGIGKIPRTRTDVQQTSRLAVRFTSHQTCFTTQHIAAYPMVHPVHESFFRIGMGNVVGSLIISAYLSLHRKILRKEKAAILATAQIECLAGGIMVYAGHSTLYMRTAAYRTDFYGEFIH